MTSEPASLNLGLIGNCAIGALVDARGAIVWCCMPRFDGDPIFHALLDSRNGLADEGVLRVEL
nr:glycoside hydrolase family 15 protein [Caldimonas sp.]